MLTSIGQRLDPEESSSLAACLAKPVKPSQLYDLLIDLFAGEEASEQNPGAAAAEFIDLEFASQRPLQILLAEDNAVNKKVALRMLERLGYRADVAANGLEVLAALECHPYDLVFMDVQMPEMDGLETTRRIRKRWGSGPGKVRIVAMTAYAYVADLEQCLRAGMDGYITKPIRFDALIDVLSGVPGDRPAQASQAEVEPGAAEVDPVRMQDLKDSLGDGLRDVIESYLEDVPLQIKEMQAALESGYRDDLQRIAHSLKSSSGIFGAQEMVEICRTLEIAAREGGIAGTDPIQEISESFAKVRTVLNSYLE
jgi:CheY-like chemotaxis protein